MNNPILSAHEVCKHYPSGAKVVRAVDGVSFTVERGKSLCVTGSSGAGKSTLLQLLGGLDLPTSGSVMLDGIDIYKLPDSGRAKIRNRRIGFVFQFFHLLPEFSAVENVMLPSMISGKHARDKASELLEAVGLGGRIDHKPSEMSGGESQRVAIARALINDPDILLCDEPTGNLDSSNSESIYKLLFDLKSKSNTAIVIVTHDSLLAKRTDQSIHLKDGRLV